MVVLSLAVVEWLTSQFLWWLEVGGGNILEYVGCGITRLHEWLTWRNKKGQTLDAGQCYYRKIA
jgi:hypothetical protein